MHPETYTDVLEQHPNMPDGLREHVSRLAMEAGESRPLVMQGLEDASVAVSSRAIQAPARHGKPSAHYMGTTVSGVRETSNDLRLKAVSYDAYTRPALNNILDGVRAFADGKLTYIEESDSSYSSWADMAAAALGYVNSAPTREERRNGLSQFIQSISYLQEGSYSSLDAVHDQATVYTIGALQALRFEDNLTSELQDIYFDHSDESSKALRSMLVGLQGGAICDSSGDERFSMDFLGTMYNDESFLDLHERAHYFMDPTLAKVFTADGAKRHIVNAELGKDIDKSKYKPAEIANIQREAAQNLLSKLAPNLPRKVAQELFFAAYSRTEPEDIADHKTRADLLSDLLDTVIENTDKLGRTAVEQLRRCAGIVNFDYYAADQLEMVNKVIEYDEKTLEHLREGDVTIAFIDALGDHNGAMKQASSLYAKPSGRTLFFEIHEPEDYDRYKTFLRAHTIEPSAVVFVNHGSPGHLLVGPEDRGYAITNEQGVLINNGTGRAKYSILSIVEDLKSYMQPSRGVDDPHDAIGHIRIIMNSCSQDKVVPPTATTPEREPVTETVAKAVGPGAIVYGGNMVIYIDGTPQGLKMGGLIPQPDGSYKDNGYIPISVIEVDASGHIHRDYVDELILR